MSRARSSAASGVPLVSAATTGSDFLRARRSARTGLPVTSGAPQMPSRSSVSWNASPTCAPNPARPIASVGGAPRCTAPMLQAHAISAAVLSPAISRHSASVTSSRFSKARSEPCPPISRCTAADRHRAAHAPCGVPSSSSRSWASASSASPARMAAPTPNTVQAVGRCLRSVSPSMMSSCSSEKLCTSSTATAAVTPRSGGAPAARADSSASAGRSALPPLAPGRVARGVGEAEVVRRDDAHVRGQPGDRRTPSPGRPGPGPGPHPQALQLSLTYPQSCESKDAVLRSSTAAARPLRTAPSIVSGHPVSVHAPASTRPGSRVAAFGRSAPCRAPGGRSPAARG